MDARFPSRGVCVEQVLLRRSAGLMGWTYTLEWKGPTSSAASGSSHSASERTLEGSLRIHAVLVGGLEREWPFPTHASFTYSKKRFVRGKVFDRPVNLRSNMASLSFRLVRPRPALQLQRIAAQHGTSRAAMVPRTLLRPPLARHRRSDCT